MSLRPEYHELARADLYAAWTWYEDQQPSLGDRLSAVPPSVQSEVIVSLARLRILAADSTSLLASAGPGFSMSSG